MSTIQCALYSTFAARCSLNPPDYALSTPVPVKSNIIAVLDIQASILNWKYLRSDWWFIHKSASVIIHIFCQIKGSLCEFRYVKSGPGKIQYNYNSCYSWYNIQLNVIPSILVMCRQFNARYTPHLLPNKGRILLFSLCQQWSLSNKIYLHFLLFSLQYSIGRISVDIGEMSRIQCALYSTFAAKFSLNPPD
jgi:hypothetical protein